MLRMKRIFFTCLLCLAFGQTAHALSLGDLNVLSGYAQPLEGEISIPLYADDDIQELNISLAPVSLFEANGIEFTKTVSQLNFSIRRKDDGTPYILVRSKEAINELMLSFVIEASWPKGRMVKAFDILLTPPAMLEKNKPSVMGNTEPVILDEPTAENSIPDQDTTTIVSEPVQKDIPRKGLPKGELKQSGPEEWSFGPVQPGQSLSQVAEKFHEVSDLSIEQRMNILFRLNPQAFGNNNINNIRAGYTLKFRNAVEFSSPQSSVTEMPGYINDIETGRSIGTVNNIQPNQITESNMTELDKLHDSLKSTRDQLGEFREENQTLRERLQALETEISERARELGLKSAP